MSAACVRWLAPALALVLAALAPGCGDDGGREPPADAAPDGGPEDAGPDGGGAEGGTDAGIEDAGPADAGATDAGCIELGGVCGSRSPRDLPCCTGWMCLPRRVDDGGIRTCRGPSGG